MTQLYKIKVGRSIYHGEYTSACVAIIIAQCIYGVHNAQARKVQP